MDLARPRYRLDQLTPRTLLAAYADWEVEDVPRLVPIHRSNDGPKLVCWSDQAQPMADRLAAAKVALRQARAAEPGVTAPELFRLLEGPDLPFDAWEWFWQLHAERPLQTEELLHEIIASGRTMPEFWAIWSERMNRRVG
jgi:hypothetical protein